MTRWAAPPEREKPQAEYLESVIPDECPESKMDDGCHATDFEDSGMCPWCGEANPDFRPKSRFSAAATGEEVTP